jgi:excisionase family DNA binding protein
VPDTHKIYISTVELAKLLGVSSVTVFKRIQSGQIKAIKIGRSYAIPRAYIEEHFPTYKIQAPIKGEYFSVMEAAEILGISRVAVFKKIQAGKMQAQRIGRHYVIEKHHIFAQQQKAEDQPVLTQEYYSIPELAEALGKSRIAIFKQVQLGKIKAQRIGRHYVIACADISGSPLRSLKLHDATAKQGASSTEKKVRSVKEDYVSVAEAAKQLGISRIAVFKKIQKGQMKAVRMGRSYAILKSEVYKHNE